MKVEVKGNKESLHSTPTRDTRKGQTKGGEEGTVVQNRHGGQRVEGRGAGQMRRGEQAAAAPS